MSFRCAATYDFACGLRNGETGTDCAGTSTVPSGDTSRKWVGGFCCAGCGNLDSCAKLPCDDSTIKKLENNKIKLSERLI